MNQIQPLAFQNSIIPLISGLINELAISIKLEDNNLIALLPNLENNDKSSNEIYAKVKRDPFTTDIVIIDPTSILINKTCLTTVNDLACLGFTKQQLALLEQNISATIYLEKIYERCKTEKPMLVNIIEQILNTKFQYEELQKKGGLANLFSILPQREAFILSDTCGNIDGSTGNPLKNLMFGKDGNAIEHHPIPIAFHHGVSKLRLIQYEQKNIRSIGTIPERLKSYLTFLNNGIIPLCSYSFNIIDENQKLSASNDCIDAFTLLSKRSFVPLKDDYQIKTSFPGQITSEIRTIDWQTARDVIHSSCIVSQLAQKQLLPDKIWVQLVHYISQVDNDDRTTFYIRDGLQDAISNSTEKGIPKELTPITSCALTSRNILTPGKTLMESMIEFGFNGEELFKTISRTVIHMQLDLIKLGWIPDSHTQNVIYLFDFKKKVFAGILQRDSECEKLHLDKLRSSNIQVPPENNIHPKLLRYLVHNDEKLLTLYLHHTIYTKHIVPMANILHEKYHIDSVMLCEYVKKCLIDWKKLNIGCNIEQDIDLSGRFYERNLACKTLNIGNPPHYRLISNHPLLPSDLYLS